MLRFFERDPGQVRWELASCGSGACRLIVHHSQGTSVETFASTAQALRRVQQLEDYLDQARFVWGHEVTDWEGFRRKGKESNGRLVMAEP